MSKQKLFIHVGIDKTGSSYIQSALYASVEGLHQAGFKYIDTGGIVNHSNLFDQSRKGNLDIWKDVALEMHDIEQNGIISHEGLYHLPEGILSTIREIFSAYQIKIVIYIRRQSEMICSGFAQRLGEEPSSFDLESDPEIAFFPIGQKYSATLDKFKDIFGEKNIYVRKYESSGFYQENLLLDFLHAIGISCNKSDLGTRFYTPHDDPNPSFDIECLYLITRFDRMGIDQGSRVKLIDLLLSITSNDKSSFIKDDVLDLADLYYQGDNNLVSRVWFEGQDLFTDPRKFKYREMDKVRLARYTNIIRDELGLDIPAVSNVLRCKTRNSLHLRDRYVVRVDGYTLQLNPKETDGLTNYQITKQGRAAYSINDTAAMVWQYCLNPVLVSSLIGYFSEKYLEISSIEIEILELLDQLYKIGLISFVHNPYRSRHYPLNYQSEEGTCSKRALRLVDYCLGDFKDKPVLPCTKDLNYLNNKTILLLEAGTDNIVISSDITQEHEDQKQVANALINQHAIIPPTLSCWLVRGDSSGTDTDSEQGLHIAGMRHSSLRHLVLVPTANRQRYLGQNLQDQMEELQQSWVPWEKKSDTAWWGGALTGDQWKVKDHRILTRREVLCYYRDNPSEQVHLQLTEVPEGTHIPSGIDLMGHFTKKMAFMNKCLVLLPGNDIASGSSWYFAGNSVVLMPEMHQEHILYFELEPWVHYIPLEREPADVLVKLRWALENQDRVRQIVENAHERLRWLCGSEYLWACNEVLRRITFETK